MYTSQYKQDLFLDKVIFNKKSKGFFIDIGAHDGFTFSNSFFFEKVRNWKGVCFEPNPFVYKKLIEERSAYCYNTCIGDNNEIVEFTQIKGYSEMLSGITSKYHSEHLDRIKKEVDEKGGEIDIIKVEMTTLQSIKEIKSNKNIDFISIDTEGNELDIINSIDFVKFNIKCIVVENNYNNKKIEEKLIRNNFKLLYRLHTDQVYINNKDYSLKIKVNLFLWKLKLKLLRIQKKLKSNFNEANKKNKG
jgi:FkbM family methyltransferase